MKEKKITINKKMSLRDYMALAYFFETGERDVDFSECDDAALGKIEKRSMRLTLEEKEKFDEFFKGTPLGVTFASLMAAVPKKKVIAPAQEQKVQIVYQQPVATPTAMPVNAPQAKPQSTRLSVPADEHPRPDGYVCPDISFYIDPNLTNPNTPDNIDLNVVINLLMDDVISEEDFWMQLGADMYKVRAASPSEFVFDTTGLPSNLVNMPYFNSVFEEVKIRKNIINDIMNEPDPTDEDRFEHFKRHAKVTCGLTAKHPQVVEWDATIDGVEKIHGNKIFFEEETNRVCEYDNVDMLERDMIYLSYNGFIEDDTMYDVFGKKVSVDKIIKKLYKKFPEGLNKGEKLYYSQKEAYLDGALKV